jgi:hypothetical protein
VHVSGNSCTSHGSRAVRGDVLNAPHTATVAVSDVSRLGGVVVSVLATGPKGSGFKPGRGDGFLMAIQIRSTPSFGWEVKPDVPCRKILYMLKIP